MVLVFTSNHVYYLVFWYRNRFIIRATGNNEAMVRALGQIQNMQIYRPNHC